MSNHEFIDIADCNHPIVNKDKYCLVCGQKLENYNPKKYRKFTDEDKALLDLGGHNHR